MRNTLSRVRLLCLCAIAIAFAAGAAAQEPPADLILHNGIVWTGDPRQPEARAVAVRGDRIVRVGTRSQVMPLRGPASRLIDLEGKLVVPGFIDAHTHFENATDWFFEVRLIDVDSEDLMLERLREAVARIPKEYWIQGVEWGGLTARKRFAAGEKDYAAFTPTLAKVDAIAPDHAVLFQRHDGAVFVNSRGLQWLRLNRNAPVAAGGEIGRDPATGELTGMLRGTSALSALRVLPPKSMQRTLVAARALVRDLNRLGITGIHDIARADDISQERVFRTNVERSHSDVGIFQALRREGALTLRVYAQLPLRVWQSLDTHGFAPGSGDEWIRYGSLKGYIDGNMTFEPWANHPHFSGGFVMRVIDEATMLGDVVAADRLGYDIGLHAFGDKAHWLMMNWYEEAARRNGPRDRRFRLVHAGFPAMREIERAGRFGAVADITPYFVIVESHEADAVLGPERARTAFAWRTLLEEGVRLNIVSDWPGYFDKTALMPVDPLQNIYYAVTRRGIGAAPETAWHPDQIITIEDALRAYTVNPAWTSREEDIKGSITAGKLADLVVLSRDIRRIKPEALLDTKVVYTLIGGAVVYQAE